VASWLATAAAGAANDDEWELFVGGTFDETGEAFADNGTHAAHDEGRIGDSKRYPAGADHTAAGDRGVLQTSSLLFRHKAFLVRLLLGKVERVSGHQMPVPFFKRAVIKDLVDAVEG